MQANTSVIDENIQDVYESKNKMKFVMLVGSIIFTSICMVYFVTVGVSDTDMKSVVNAIMLCMSGNLDFGANAAQNKIIILIRLPRLVMAIVSGIGLSVSGVAMQSITRNPLVSPFTIGVSSAASFGASIAIVFGVCFFKGSEIGIVINAFISAIACAFVVYMVSKKAKMSPIAIVLTGIALNYFFSAMTSSIEFFAQEHKLASVVHWSFGSFNASTWSEVVVVSIFVFVCTIIIYKYKLALNVMSCGDDELVMSLGMNAERIRCIMGFVCVLMSASIISFCGVIGFVGLIAPHMARLLAGNDHKYLLAFAGVIGALLLMVSDTLGRVVLSPVVIPVGIVVSFLGVPLFVHLIMKNRRENF